MERFDIADIGGVLQEHTSREVFEKWLMGLWMNWKDLCEVKHGGQFNGSLNLKLVCENYIACYGVAKEQAALQKRVLPLEGNDKWIKPKMGRYRLDVDYAMDDATGAAGVGAIAHDCYGVTLFALAKPIAMSPNVTHGELRAVMHGICQCVEEALSPVEVYSDSLLAVHIIEEGREVPGVLHEELIKFFALVKELNILSVNHMRREANSAAHLLASVVKSLDSLVIWHGHWPSWLLEIVSRDSCR